MLSIFFFWLLDYFGPQNMHPSMNFSAYPGSTSNTGNVNTGSTNLIDIENNPSRNDD